MFKTLTIMMAGLFTAAPAAAQTAPAPATAVAADAATLAEARLVTARLLPTGIYNKMMGPMMAPLMDGMGETMKALPLRRLAEMGGLSAEEAGALDQVHLDEVMAIYDPHWQERLKLQTSSMFAAMGEFFTTLEPEMREAMAHAYANNFTLAELTDIDRFLASPSGAKYAAQYMTIMSDPAMAAEMKSMMPKMMEQMPQFIAAAQKASASLPPPRRIEDLSPAERARLAKALGIDESKLRDPKTAT